MLVLSRRKDEVIRIGDVEIMVVKIMGNAVKLGVNAPPEVVIRRGELCSKPWTKRGGAAHGFHS